MKAGTVGLVGVGRRVLRGCVVSHLLIAGSCVCRRCRCERDGAGLTTTRPGAACLPTSTISSTLPSGPQIRSLTLTAHTWLSAASV